MSFRIVDLETTGLVPPDHAPVEVAWRDMRRSAGGDWFVAGGNELLCNPGRGIPSTASAVHHLVDRDVATAMPWKSALKIATDTAGDGIIYVAHNAAFERQWFDEFMPAGQWICTWKCALRLWPEAPAHSNQVLRYWRLGEAVDRSLASPAHRAGPDAYVTSELLLRMLGLATTDMMVRWSEEPALLARIPFGNLRGRPWREAANSFLDWVLSRDFDADVMFTARHELARRLEADRHDLDRLADDGGIAA